MTGPVVNLVVALPAEAKPLRRHFALERDPKAQLPLYRGEGMLLAVCGVGSKAAAQAVAGLAKSNPQPGQGLWINMGIAGHPFRPVGEAVLAGEIRDQSTGEHWVTQLPPDPPCAVDRLMTLTRPDPAYRWQGLQDMEATGFYASACIHAQAARVQCLKVVSDNLQQPADGISGSTVSSLMTSRLKILEHLIGQLQDSMP